MFSQLFSGLCACLNRGDSIVAKGDQEKFLEGHTPLIFASGVRAYRTDVSVHTKAGNTVSAHIEIRTHRDPDRQLTATVLRVVPAEGLAPFVDMKDRLVPMMMK